MLAKKYKSTPRTIKKYLIKAKCKLNFKEGSLKNYKVNKGSFKKNTIPWNKNKKMSRKFCNMRRKIMIQKVKKGLYR